MQFLELIVVAIMVFVNGVFAAYEIALASISVARLQFLVSQHRRGAGAALAMKEGIEQSLAVVQLGITLVGLIAGATGGASATEDIAPWLQRLGCGERTADVLAVALIVVPLTAVTIVVGELMPKLFALRHKEWVCLTLSPMMRFFARCTWPIVWFLETSASGLMDQVERMWSPKQHGDHSRESAELQELRAIASMARASRLIGAREENIILGAARLASRKINEIMLPAEHIRMLALEDALGESLIAAHVDLHTRFPVSKQADDPQQIVGYVTFKDIVSAMKLNPEEPSVRGILRPIPSLPADVPISSALEFLLKEHTHIALVRSPANEVLGLITLEDIVEELVGDIQDEHDLLPLHIIRSGHGWIIGGGASLARVKDLTGVDLPPLNSATHNLSGWIVERLSEPPHGSEVVRLGNVRILVRKVRRHRVLEALVATEQVERKSGPFQSSEASGEGQPIARPPVP